MSKKAQRRNATSQSISDFNPANSESMTFSLNTRYEQIYNLLAKNIHKVVKDA